jgi:hypothetical protein
MRELRLSYTSYLRTALLRFFKIGVLSVGLCPSRGPFRASQSVCTLQMVCYRFWCTRSWVSESRSSQLAVELRNPARVLSQLDITTVDELLGAFLAASSSTQSKSTALM